MQVLHIDSNMSSFMYDPSSFQTVRYQCKDEDDNGIIDLGLSLKTLQPQQAYHQSGHVVSLEGYGEIMDWPHLKNYAKIIAEDCEDEAVQSKARWAYIKVNMDGAAVGRKVCILDHGGYSSLALQLEDMFGRQFEKGLRLFQASSEFNLFYKDRVENWRTVGDVPWQEFVDSVTRIRIARKNAVLIPSSSTFI